MFPIRDTTPTQNAPIVNSTIIGFNVIIFVIQLAQGPEVNQFNYIYGLVPARYTDLQIAAYFNMGQQLLSFFSFMFLHGGFVHLLGNMWFLYIFGDNVEDRLGHLRYIVFYLLCGWASGLSHLFLNLNSEIPIIGASGAIAGVMGAYFILHPFAKILTLIPILFIPLFIEIPAFFFLGFWLFYRSSMPPWFEQMSAVLLGGLILADLYSGSFSKKFLRCYPLRVLLKKYAR